MSAGDAIHVMAGVLVDAAGRVLLAQRPPGKHLAGLWEFPGGKREAGESPSAALARELHEELGIEAEPGEPVLSLPWRYGDRLLRLEALRVPRWRGEPQPREGQSLQWLAPAAIQPAQLTPADRPVLAALKLPPTYPITPPQAGPAEVREALLSALVRGERLLLLRHPRETVAMVRAVAGELLAAARAVDAVLMLHDDIEGARGLGDGVGVHLSGAGLRRLGQRPLPPGQWVAASCHDADELRLAAALQVDFAVLSPVAATASHAGVAGRGWPWFAGLVADAPMPVYALGGMRPADVDLARASGGQGVAGIRAFW